MEILHQHVSYRVHRERITPHTPNDVIVRSMRGVDHFAPGVYWEIFFANIKNFYKKREFVKWSRYT